MSKINNGSGPVLAEADFETFKRKAAIERAEAIKAMGRAIAGWLRSGIKLRYSGDDFTHPARQPNVQLLMRWG